MKSSVNPSLTGILPHETGKTGMTKAESKTAKTSIEFQVTGILGRIFSYYLFQLSRRSAVCLLKEIPLNLNDKISPNLAKKKLPHR